MAAARISSMSASAMAAATAAATDCAPQIPSRSWLMEASISAMAMARSTSPAHSTPTGADAHRRAIGMPICIVPARQRGTQAFTQISGGFKFACAAPLELVLRGHVLEPCVHHTVAGGPAAGFDQNLRGEHGKLRIVGGPAGSLVEIRGKAISHLVFPACAKRRRNCRQWPGRSARRAPCRGKGQGFAIAPVGSACLIPPHRM